MLTPSQRSYAFKCFYMLSYAFICFHMLYMLFTCFKSKCVTRRTTTTTWPRVTRLPALPAEAGKNLAVSKCWPYLVKIITYVLMSIIFAWWKVAVAVFSANSACAFAIHHYYTVTQSDFYWSWDLWCLPNVCGYTNLTFLLIALEIRPSKGRSENCDL